MTDTLDLDHLNVPAPAVFTRTQRRAIIIFAIFGALTLAATLILTIQLNDTVAALSTTLFNHIVHR